MHRDNGNARRPVATVTVTAPSLGDDEVSERMAAIERCYTDPTESSLGQVIVADGYGLSVRVESGQLEISDGIGPHRRVRRLPRAQRSVRRLVVMGDGVMSTGALRWCSKVGISVAVLSDGALTLATSPPGRDDARLRRAQSLASDHPVGLVLVRQLLEDKLAGQARNLRTHFARTELASTVERLIDTLGGTSSVDELRQLEAAAANAYFSVWADSPLTEVRFAARDRRRIPPTWQHYQGRRSVIARSSNRKATHPLNAFLNYLFQLAEIEAVLALQVCGLDPGLGILHLDTPGRPSLALDLIEPIRPAIEAFALELIASRTFAKADFHEGADGTVRVCAPLSHELAATIVMWGKAVAPWVEHVVHVFGTGLEGSWEANHPTYEDHISQRRFEGARPEVSPRWKVAATYKER